ncbi:hypothetical protein NE236_42065 [Actinoallomurus purpureus]|uniref:DUF6245 family protein n=1 Tax=Actinoallomurus purpureus TaxID=478114 RepID=UPI0020921A69|nr:DUF6245 family protein [Actinoallomurus purpureus]MCO6011557.1 hypothetical protein [Actinoallomurus purpureus]
MSSSVPPAPTAASISAALAALGAYAKPPTDTELAAQAEAAGGEHVLAAVLANALYGAAIGAGMLAEGHMLAKGAGAREMTLARNQVIKASGAAGPGVTGMLHWQASQIAEPLRAWTRKADLGPTGNAAADIAWALVILLQATTVTDPGDPRFATLGQNITETIDYLNTAVARLTSLKDAAGDLAAMLAAFGHHGTE